ncbi:MAG: fibronectin type III domain-containing protein [Thermodesulfobacteriota bacterium]
MFFRFAGLSPLPLASLTCLGLWSVNLSSLPLPAAHAAEVKVAWNANPEPHLAGYKLYYGQASKTYSSAVRLGKTTAYTVSGLEEGRTYYFTLTAYDTSGREGKPSAEIIHNIPDVDTDGDGLTDRQERDLYKTDPRKADTDGDGLGDGREVAYWGSAWGKDPDGDSLTNLLDPDSDGDGAVDGEELRLGYNPGDAKSVPPPPIVKIWLEAEEGAVIPPMVVAKDSLASGEQYVWTPNKSGNVTDPLKPAGEAQFVFEIPRNDVYVIWGRVRTQVDDDSFHVAIDGDYADAAMWDTVRSTSKEPWRWDQVNDRSVADPALFELKAGVHTLHIKHREDGARIDQVLITNDLDFVPQGLGE